MSTDLKREIPTYTAHRGRFSIVTVPPLQYLAVDGHGDPNTAPEYTAAVTSLYPLAYALKALSRRDLDRDHVVMPLEAQWWSSDPAVFTSRRDASRWDWTLLTLLPPWLTAEHVETARRAVAREGGAPALDRVRVEHLDEGRCVQTLHVGPYDDEGPVLAALHEEFIPRNGLRPTGKHHEVYLSDARRTAPARLRTILRQPVVTA